MKRTVLHTDTNRSTPAANPALQVLLAQSGDEFYGSLQCIWNKVVELEDIGIIQQETDKFMYAYRFAEPGSDLSIREAMALKSELSCRYFTVCDEAYPWLPQH